MSTRAHRRSTLAAVDRARARVDELFALDRLNASRTRARVRGAIYRLDIAPLRCEREARPPAAEKGATPMKRKTHVRAGVGNNPLYQPS